MQREKLRELTRCSTVEMALRYFTDFASELSPTSSTVIQLHRLPVNDRMGSLLREFEKWYFQKAAPNLVSMNAPWDWFPVARLTKRRFIFHCGPTNSGKTHAALTRLREAPSGVYCAPLKALASQVWHETNAHGIRCDLLIGDERKFAGFAEHVSCTVEMTPVDVVVDVGVIDEIQLLEDKDRGWAWTRALLGLPAREVHLCGEERTLPAIKRLLTLTREERHLEVVRHERKLPLAMERSSLRGQLRNLESGDCFVTFSRGSVLATAENIRRTRADLNVHVVYGGLPFAVRERETQLFNSGVQDRHGAHVLVSTDAIAYGLNLNIRRIVFGTLRKFDGKETRMISKSTSLQIAGRAGRYGMAHPEGRVTAFFDDDHDKLCALLQTREGPIRTQEAGALIQQTGLLPTLEVLSAWIESQRRLPVDQDFGTLVEQFVRNARSLDCFFLCDTSKSLVPIAKALSTVVGISDVDRCVFCFAPVSVDSESLFLLRGYAEKHASQKPVELPLSRADIEVASAQRLEWWYRAVEVYCWLAMRFRISFVDYGLGAELKLLISARIQSRL